MTSECCTGPTDGGRGAVDLHGYRQPGDVGSAMLMPRRAA